MEKLSIQYPYGAVYFRKSNPPRKDWERDYARAAEDGMNIFRHWFLWGSIEIAPGVYDWEDYDRQLELAQKYGIKTIIAEITTSLPEWAIAKYPELLPKDNKFNTIYPEMGVSCATGGFFTGFCLDHPAAREMVANFLHKLAERYKNHGALLGYDVANECYLSKDICYCRDTIHRYQVWLGNKYKDIKTVNKIWNKYSYTDFSEIMPTIKPGFFQDSVDWLSFRREQSFENIRWKIATIKEADNKNVITAHGLAGTLTSFSENCCDDWEAAKNVEIYGLTWVQSRKGNEPWKQFSSMDLTRASTKGKPFWHTEAQGGPLWLQPQLPGRKREDGRIVTAEDLRIWNLISMACGASGILYTRYRPLLEGPLFGAFAPYEMDGSRTERSNMGSSIAKWANRIEQKELFEAKPIVGEIGILFVPECETASYLLSQYGNENAYASMMWGAYRGFFDNNIQADFVHIDDIDDIDSRKAIYIPYPVDMTQVHAEKLKAWVKKGGFLISEACPAYFTDQLQVGERQPSYGLDEVFGVLQNNVEFMPDLMNDMEFELLGLTVAGGGYLQTYDLLTAEKVAVYKDAILAAHNSYGSGRTLIIGTNISYGYFKHPERGCDIFAKLLEFTGTKALLQISDENVKLRIHQNGAKRYLWILNPTSVMREVTITSNTSVGYGKAFWLGGSINSTEQEGLWAAIEAKNAIIIEIFL